MHVAIATATRSSSRQLANLSFSWLWNLCCSLFRGYISTSYLYQPFHCQPTTPPHKLELKQRRSSSRKKRGKRVLRKKGWRMIEMITKMWTEAPADERTPCVACDWFHHRHRKIKIKRAQDNMWETVPLSGMKNHVKLFASVKIASHLTDYLIHLNDTFHHREKEKNHKDTLWSSSSSMESGMESLDHMFPPQLAMLHSYEDLQTALQDYSKTCAQENKVVTKEEITRFFDDLNKSRSSRIPAHLICNCRWFTCSACLSPDRLQWHCEEIAFLALSCFCSCWTIHR